MMLSSDVTDLQAFIELMPTPVIVKNYNHRIILVNELACELFQRSRQILTAQGAGDLFARAEARGFHEADDRVFAHGAIDETEERLTDARGKVRYLITSKQRISIKNIDYLIAVLTDVTAYREAEAHSRHLALHDALTGLPNRALFWKRIEIAVSENPGKNALLFIDLDNFKFVNDTYGHAIGDELIKDFVDRLSHIIRPTDTVARIGGDEFAVLLTYLTDNAVIEEICARIILDTSQLTVRSGRNAQIGSSIGVVMPGCGLDDQAEMLRRADVALYQAKRDGRGRWRAYTEELNRAMAESRSERRGIWAPPLSNCPFT